MRVSELRDAQTFEGDLSSSMLRAPNETKSHWTIRLGHETFVHNLLSINVLFDLLTMTKWWSNQTASIAAQRTRMERSMQRYRATGASSRRYGEGQLITWFFGELAPSRSSILTTFTSQTKCRFSLAIEVRLVGSKLHFIVLSVHSDGVKTRRKFEPLWPDISVSCSVRWNNTGV